MQTIHAEGALRPKILFQTQWLMCNYLAVAKLSLVLSPLAVICRQVGFSKKLTMYLIIFLL